MVARIAVPALRASNHSQPQEANTKAVVLLD
jgi:hypothetical protein